MFERQLDHGPSNGIGNASSNSHNTLSSLSSRLKASEPTRCHGILGHALRYDRRHERKPETQMATLNHGRFRDENHGRLVRLANSPHPRAARANVIQQSR
jgi:hypothetical protein